ncbi:hypothetical protein EV2_018925 [Malus domestica]
MRTPLPREPTTETPSASSSVSLFNQSNFMIIGKPLPNRESVTGLIRLRRIPVQVFYDFRDIIVYNDKNKHDSGGDANDNNGEGNDCDGGGGGANKGVWRLGCNKGVQWMGCKVNNNGKGNNNGDDASFVIPWKLILSKPPVWTLIVCHFCHNWGTFILLTWMPTYYNQVLKSNLTESGLLCVLPWLTMAIFANIGGWIANALVSKGFSVTTVRKIMQSIGFLRLAFFLTLMSRVKTPVMGVLCIACSQGSDAFSQSGLYSNHQDIGPRYAGVLLGLSNTAGVLAGVFGTDATGYILQRGFWDDSKHNAIKKQDRVAKIYTQNSYSHYDDDDNCEWVDKTGAPGYV